jgi:hypothetical protein
MSTPRKPDTRARVEQARAAAELSLVALRARRAAWDQRLQAMPYWALLLGGFVGGALAGRVLGRVRPRRAALELVTALGPLWRLMLEGAARIYAPSTSARPPAPDAAAQGDEAARARD